MGRKRERELTSRPEAHADGRSAGSGGERTRGMQAFQRGDYGAAISAWEILYRRAPGEPLARALAEAHFRRACLNSRRLPAQALEDLRLAVELVPDDARYLYHRGLALHRQNNHTEAIAAYRESLRCDPQHYTQTAYTLALALAESGGDPSADESWELLTTAQRQRLVPGSKSFVAATEALQRADYDTAEPALRRLLSGTPGFANYYLGVIAQARGDEEKALDHWLIAHAAGFQTAALRQNLATAYTRRAILQAAEDSPELAATLRVALRLAPASPMLHKLKQRVDFAHGVEAAEAGEWIEALEYWRAARYDPAGQPMQAPRALIANLALAYEQLGRHSEAAETWREFLRKRPRSGESVMTPAHVAMLWRHIETLYARAGNLDQSVAALRYAIKSQPEDLFIRLALARRHLENDSVRAARAVVMRTLEIAPEHPEVCALYAEICDLGSDLDEMIEAWEKVARLGDKRHAHTANHRLVALYGERAALYRSVDEHNAATIDLAKALALAPDNMLLRARYGAALLAEVPEAAVTEFSQVDLRDIEAALIVVGSHYRAGNPAAAHWLERALSADGHGAALPARLGALLLPTDAAQATAFFAQAVARARQDKHGPQWLNMIAVLYASRDQMAEAFDYARRAIGLDSRFGPAHLSLGLWSAARGNRVAARDHFNRALVWAQNVRQHSIAEGVEEALARLDERATLTFDEVLETIDPAGDDIEVRTLLGIVPEVQL
jgi:tetratricopeptide (TPR) repeat protein